MAPASISVGNVENFTPLHTASLTSANVFGGKFDSHDRRSGYFLSSIRHESAPEPDAEHHRPLVPGQHPTDVMVWIRTDERLQALAGAQFLLGPLGKFLVRFAIDADQLQPLQETVRAGLPTCRAPEEPVVWLPFVAEA